jgi:CRISPR type III-B/RAMP module-associated protein Cmr5
MTDAGSMERRIAIKAQDLVKSQCGRLDHEADYRSFAEGLPALLRTAGLAQTLSFLRAKNCEPHSSVYANLEEHFRDLCLLGRDKSLVEMTLDPTAMPAAQYRLYSRLSLRMAFWHRRLAQALLKTRRAGRPK